jgi:hypothetical protein
LISDLFAKEFDASTWSDGSGIRTAFLTDPRQDRFLLIDIGWEPGRRVNDVVLHVSLRDGKILIEEDWTERGVKNDFLEAGVPEEDIVLEFIPPYRRPQMSSIDLPSDSVSQPPAEVGRGEYPNYGSPATPGTTAV